MDLLNKQVMKIKLLLFSMLIWCVSSCGSDPFIGEQRYVLTVEVRGQGRVLGEGVYKIEETAVLQAYPDSVNHYTFKGWYFQNKLISSKRTYAVKMDGRKTYVALFGK